MLPKESDLDKLFFDKDRKKVVRRPHGSERPMKRVIVEAAALKKRKEDKAGVLVSKLAAKETVWQSRLKRDRLNEQW